MSDDGRPWEEERYLGVVVVGALDHMDGSRAAFALSECLFIEICIVAEARVRLVQLRIEGEGAHGGTIASSVP